MPSPQNVSALSLLPLFVPCPPNLLGVFRFCDGLPTGIASARTARCVQTGAWTGARRPQTAPLRLASTARSAARAGSSKSVSLGATSSVAGERAALGADSATTWATLSHAVAGCKTMWPTRNARAGATRVIRRTIASTALVERVTIARMRQSVCARQESLARRLPRAIRRRCDARRSAVSPISMLIVTCANAKPARFAQSAWTRA